MNCCQGLESQFDQREAANDLAEYQQHGAAPATRLLLDALLAAGVAGQTLLDIGGGVGVIQHELLAAGLAHATDVDAASAYLATARAEAARRGFAERTTYMHGNFVDLARSVMPADIVTLDRVLCCYHDMPALVAASAAKAQHRYGLIYPRDGWWMAAATRLLNAGLWLQRTSFRVFYYPRVAVDAAVRQQGLEPTFHTHSGLWQVALYTRRVSLPQSRSSPLSPHPVLPV